VKTFYNTYIYTGSETVIKCIYNFISVFVLHFPMYDFFSLFASSYIVLEHNFGIVVYNILVSKLNLYEDGYITSKFENFNEKVISTST